MTIEYDLALQDCLDQLEEGLTSIDAVILQYPDYAQDLKQQLEAAQWIRNQRSTLDPSPEFVQGSRQRIINRIKHETAKKAVPEPIKVPWWQGVFEYLQHNMQSRTLVPMGFVLILLVMMFTGTRILVPVAYDSLPGDRLYSAKLALEQAELAVSLDNADAAQLNVILTQRRFTEIMQMIAYGRYDQIDDSVQNFEQQVEQTVESVNAVAGDNVIEAAVIAAALERILSQQDQTLTILGKAAPPLARSAIGRAIQASRSGMTAVQQIRRNLPPVSVVVAPTQTPTPTSKPKPTDTRIAPTQAPTQAPTATPTSRPLPTKPPEPTATPTQVPPPTNTPLPPTNTPIPTATPVPPTATPVPPTDTPLPPTATPTPLPPTATYTPVPSPTSAPTMVPPTATPVPTNTPQPTGASLPTATQETPTATP